MRVLLWLLVVKVMLLMLHGKSRLAGVTPEDGADERLAGPEQAADAIGDGGARPGPGPDVRQRRRRHGSAGRWLRRRQQQRRRLWRRGVGG